MSVDRGKALQRAAARYLSQWFADAESAPPGRNGRDIIRVPAIAFEVKTPRKFDAQAFCRQARRNARNVNGHMDLPVVLYAPDGMGAESVGSWLMLLTVDDGMRLLEDAGYAVRLEDQARALDNFTALVESE